MKKVAILATGMAGAVTLAAAGIFLWSLHENERIREACEDMDYEFPDDEAELAESDEAEPEDSATS